MKKNTRELLLDAAVLTFAKNPSAPISDVADAAGVGRATLYRHFPSRDDLVRELVLESYQQTGNAIESVLAKKLTGEELLLNILEAIIPLGDRYYFLLMERTFDDDPEIQALYEKDIHDWQTLFEDLQREGILASDISIVWAISVVESLIYSAWSSVHEGYIARREAHKLVYRTLISGLGPKKS